jgi:glycosyltransferase involved in cell wall biosynthesis
MDKSPQITVVATVLNEADVIGELIASLSRQSFTDFEIVIVDGGSTDGTWERLQEFAARDSRLRVIRDETCNLKASPGPIARGRNRAIDHARAAVIACADAGCHYDPQWLANLTAPILGGQADYALGGSYIDAANATTWDIASAPFLGVKLDPKGIRKSCTARSMAMRKGLWEKVGGFPEQQLFGEDTLFDLRARQLTTPAFVGGAMASYRPRFAFRSAAARFGLYAHADGVLGVRRTRLVRNLLRCIAQTAAVIALPWTRIPLLIVVLLELFFAFERDRSVFTRRVLSLLPARLLFSLLAPWIITANYVRGSVSKVNRPNAQNAHA